MTALFVWGLAYLIGSIPCGVLVARSQHINLRSHGSGNIGATNVARVIGKKAGLLTLGGDVFKGCLGVAIAGAALDGAGVALAGLLTFLGHLFPVFLKFRGGKGVATGLGICLYLMPYAALSTAAVFAATMMATRYVSLSSILGAFFLPLFGWLYGAPAAYVFMAAAMSALSVLKHHENIRRLIAGAESKFQAK